MMRSEMVLGNYYCVTALSCGSPEQKENEHINFSKHKRSAREPSGIVLWHVIKQPGVAALARPAGLITTASKSEPRRSKMLTFESPPIHVVPSHSLCPLSFIARPRTRMKIIRGRSCEPIMKTHTGPVISNLKILNKLQGRKQM